MAGGQETRGQVSEGLSADGRGPTESVREHRDLGEGAGGESAPVVYLAREATLRKEVSQLKRVLAEKVLEVDFFKGALQHVEARRQPSGKSGARASTPRFGT